jgi:hypothetical protein
MYEKYGATSENIIEEKIKEIPHIEYGSEQYYKTILEILELEEVTDENKNIHIKFLRSCISATKMLGYLQAPKESIAEVMKADGAKFHGKGPGKFIKSLENGISNALKQYGLIFTVPKEFLGKKVMDNKEDSKKKLIEEETPKLHEKVDDFGLTIEDINQYEKQVGANYRREKRIIQAAKTALEIPELKQYIVDLQKKVIDLEKKLNRNLTDSPKKPGRPAKEPKPRESNIKPRINVRQDYIDMTTRNILSKEGTIPKYEFEAHFKYHAGVENIKLPANTYQFFQRNLHRMEEAHLIKIKGNGHDALISIGKVGKKYLKHRKK